MSVLTQSVANGYIADLERGLAIHPDHIQAQGEAETLASQMDFVAKQLRMAIQTGCREFQPVAC